MSEIEDLDSLSASDWKDKDVEQTETIRAKRAKDLKVLFDAYEPDTESEDALLKWVMKRLTEAARRKFDGNKGEGWEDAAMGAAFAISTKLRAKSFPSHLSLLKYMGTTIKHFSADAVKGSKRAEQREQPLMITKHKRKGDHNSDTFEVVNQRTPTFRFGYRASPTARAAQLCLSTQEQQILTTLARYGKSETQQLFGLSDNTMNQIIKRITARVVELKQIIAALTLDVELAESPGASRFVCLLLRLRMLPKAQLPKTFADAVALGLDGLEGYGTERFRRIALDLAHHKNHYVTTVSDCFAEDSRAQRTWEQAVRYLLKLEKQR